MDTRITREIIKLSKDSDILISEATHSAEEQELAEEHKHLTSIEAAKIAKTSKSKKLILTHLSQRYDVAPKIILNEAKDFLKGTKIEVSIAEDFDKLEM